MRESIQPSVNRRKAQSSPDSPNLVSSHPPFHPSNSSPPPGVYANLDTLVRLQFRASGFSFLPRQPIHSLLAGRHASRLRGRGLNFEEIRRYLPGDDIRNMDWKVTARLQKPHVRVYTEERDRPVMLLVDQRQPMFFGSQRAMKSVVAAELAALAAWRVLSVGDRIGAIVFNDHDLVEIPPHRSRERVMAILHHVVAMNHALSATPDRDPDPSMLNRAMERMNRRAKHDTLVTNITDGFGADEDTVRCVTSLTEHNDMLTLFVHDPLEANLSEGGRLVMEGEGGQLTVDTGEGKIRERFSREFKERVEWMKGMSQRRSIPFLPISTHKDPADQVRGHLGYVPRGIS